VAKPRKQTMMHRDSLTWIPRSPTRMTACARRIHASSDADFGPRRQRREAGVSGNWWSARVEGRARRLREDKNILDRQIDRRLGKCKRQSRWRGGQRVTNGACRHADRAKQVGLVAVMMGRALLVIGRGEGGYLGGESIVDRMNVAKGQAEIDSEREQRKPRTTSDMVTKPAHSARAGFFPWDLPDGPFLVGPPKRSSAQQNTIPPSFQGLGCTRSHFCSLPCGQIRGAVGQSFIRRVDRSQSWCPLFEVRAPSPRPPFTHRSSRSQPRPAQLGANDPTLISGVRYRPLLTFGSIKLPGWITSREEKAPH